MIFNRMKDVDFFGETLENDFKKDVDESEEINGEFNLFNFMK